MAEDIKYTGRTKLTPIFEKTSVRHYPMNTSLTVRGGLVMPVEQAEGIDRKKRDDTNG